MPIGSASPAKSGNNGGIGEGGSGGKKQKQKAKAEAKTGIFRTRCV
jgi:hypothetical protein